MQKNTPVLSVIMPVYNSAPYLKRALDSIFSQKCVPDEVICVDDGSTDDSYMILSKYAELHKEIMLLRTENNGEVSAKKEAIEYANGKYISFVDSDDWIDENMYSEMLEKGLEYDADVVTSGLIRDFGEVSAVETEHIKPGVYEGERLRRDLLSNLIDQDVFFRRNIASNVVNKIFKKSILYDHQLDVPNDIAIGEDICVAYPCLFDSNCVYVMGKDYYHYCIRGDSLMGAMDPQKYLSITKMLTYVKDYFMNASIDARVARKQYDFLYTHMHLFWKPEDVLEYNNEVLKYYGNIPRDSKVVLYGAGGFGISLKRYIEERTDINIIAWVDKNANGEDISRPDILNRIDYDYILVAILIADIVSQVENQLLSMGISPHVIKTINPNL